jgi:hypothetical protein
MIMRVYTKSSKGRVARKGLAQGVAKLKSPVHIDTDGGGVITNSDHI